MVLVTSYLTFAYFAVKRRVADSSVPRSADELKRAEYRYIQHWRQMSFNEFLWKRSHCFEIGVVFVPDFKLATLFEEGYSDNEHLLC